MTDETATAFHQLRALARPFRFRVVADAEGWPVIPGRLGQMEWFTSTAISVYAARPRVFSRLLAVPGLIPWQVGSTEIRLLAPVEALPALAPLLRLRRRRSLSPEAARKLGAGTAYSPTSGG